MKIIETRRAPNPRRVRIFLAEKGIDMAFEEIDIMKEEHKQAGFARVNPLRRVPVLKLDDGTNISESVAICRYFEELQPEPALFGTTALEKAVVEMWNRRMEYNLLFHIAQYFRHLNPHMAHLEVPQIPAWGEANKARALEGVKLLDTQLASNAFVAGSKYSIADITAQVAIDFLKPARIERPSGLTHLKRWHEEISSRASATA